MGNVVSVRTDVRFKDRSIGINELCTHGDLSFLANGRYLKDYSYQLGYVLFNEVIIRFVELL